MVIPTLVNKHHVTITLVENFTFVLQSSNFPLWVLLWIKTTTPLENPTIALTMYLSSTFNFKKFNKVKKTQYHQNWFWKSV
jgi:hypothetical protein